MKTSLTQKQILQISRQTGMSFDFRMPKKGMMQWVDAGLSGNTKAFDFAQAVISADKQAQRENKLKSLGL
jgi:predicted amidohydrolase